MDSGTSDTLRGRLRQTRVLKRVALRKILGKVKGSEVEQARIDQTIAFRFLESPTIENVDELCYVFGYSRVRRAIHILDKVVFEEFFYGKLSFYPLWVKRFAQLFEAAKPRQAVRELKSNQE